MNKTTKPKSSSCPACKIDSIFKSNKITKPREGRSDKNASNSTSSNRKV